jgi:predicted DCC family thiol-disulfide oxidoreductase YuxK
MDVGTFSLTVFAAYLGLLIDDDFRTMRTRLNARHPSPIVVLFDGRCGFCKRSIFVLSMLDWLHRLQFSSYHDPDHKKRYASHLSSETLNAEMHVRLSDGTFRKGFFAFRAMAWHLPALWIFAPFLYIPGVSVLGSVAYSWVAEHR